jgi:hypothetical protein
MNRFRFSLLALFGFVTFASVGCAALASGNEAWCVVIATATLATLGIAVFLSIFGRGQRRAFSRGFAVNGWIYLGFFYLNIGQPSGRPETFSYSYYFATSWVLEKYCTSTGREITFELNRGDDEAKFMQTYFIGQSLWTILLGFVGGLSARHLYLRREQREPGQKPYEPGTPGPQQ